MFEIQFFDWKPGLDKVRLIKLIREDAGVSLREASRVVDTLLAEKKASVKAKTLAGAQHLAGESNKLGAIAKVVSAGGMAAQAAS